MEVLCIHGISLSGVLPTIRELAEPPCFRHSLISSLYAPKFINRLLLYSSTDRDFRSKEHPLNLHTTRLYRRPYNLRSIAPLPTRHAKSCLLESLVDPVIHALILRRTYHCQNLPLPEQRPARRHTTRFLLHCRDLLLRREYSGYSYDTRRREELMWDRMLGEEEYKGVHVLFWSGLARSLVHGYSLEGF